MSIDDVPEYVLAKQLKEAGFPQTPGIVIGGIDGELKIGRYLACRIEGECGVCILRDDEYQKYIEANDPRNYIVKLPLFEEFAQYVSLAYLNHNYITDGSPEWEAKEWEAREITQDGERRKGYGHTPTEALGRRYLLLRTK